MLRFRSHISMIAVTCLAIFAVQRPLDRPQNKVDHYAFQTRSPRVEQACFQFLTAILGGSVRALAISSFASAAAHQSWEQNQNQAIEEKRGHKRRRVPEPQILEQKLQGTEGNSGICNPAELGAR